MDKVLLVDRDRDFLERLETDLTKLSQFEVAIASDGPEAVEIL